MPRSRSRSRGRSHSKGRRSRSHGRRSTSRGRRSRSRQRSGNQRGRLGGRRSPSPRRSGPSRSPFRRGRSRSGDRGGGSRGDLRQRIRRSLSPYSRRSPRRNPAQSRGRQSPSRGRHSPPRTKPSPDRNRSRDGGRRDRVPTAHSSMRREDRSRSPAASTPAASAAQTVTARPSLKPLPKGELGYTGRSLNERFATKYDPLDFQPEDNISVAIERNIKGQEEANVDVPLKPALVTLPRRRDEGEKPFTEREEFQEREDEEAVEEKRTITVKAASLENRRLLDRLDKQYGSKSAAPSGGRDFEVRRDRPGHSSGGDLRERLGRKRSGRDEPPEEEGNWQDDLPPGDRRRIDAGRLAGRLGAPDPLPDFSSRPDKYALSWVDDPAMIPTSGMYYEHDTRDNPEYNSRGERRVRGRGGFERGRGFRGGFRGGFERGRGFRGGNRGGFGGRGRGWRPAYEPTWKHDKFMDQDDNKDEDKDKDQDNDGSDNKRRSSGDADRHKDSSSSRGGESKSDRDRDHRSHRDSDRHRRDSHRSDNRDRDRDQHKRRRESTDAARKDSINSSSSSRMEVKAEEPTSTT